MEGIPTVRDVITPGDFMFKLDLKDAYFMIPVAEDHQNVSIFPMKREMLSLYMSSIQSINSPLGIYQNDPPSGAVPQIQRCKNDDLPQRHALPRPEGGNLPETRNLVLDLLESLGFLINYKKSKLSPVQTISFIGFTIDS